MTEVRFEELIKELVASEDITTYVNNQGVIRIDFMDFGGFDEDYSETEREYEKPELVEELEDFFAEVLEGDFYREGEIFGKKYRVGYDSMNI